jgi:hypothetical protein
MLRAEPAPGAIPDDLEPIEVTSPMTHARISLAGGGLPSRVPAGPPAPAGARYLGTLVHRLLEHGALDLVGHGQALRRLAERLAALGGHATGIDQAEFVAPALALVGALAGDEVLASRLRQRPAWHEVPVVLRDGTCLWRGAVDAIVHADSAGLAEVFEFKTGRPQSSHEAQLDLYVRAVAALLQDVRVTGLLVYPEVPSGL